MLALALQHVEADGPPTSELEENIEWNVFPFQPFELVTAARVCASGCVFSYLIDFNSSGNQPCSVLPFEIKVQLLESYSRTTLCSALSGMQLGHKSRISVHDICTAGHFLHFRFGTLSVCLIPCLSLQRCLEFQRKTVWDLSAVSIQQNSWKLFFTLRNPVALVANPCKCFIFDTNHRLSRLSYILLFV